ncbi:MAG TPA: F0F1 ATP synthase subunit A [Polyangia bacterium]|jgi:F-type H+-transporting ATPase subunit a|nr:F0F1 ATP synthase subunit A [Polyangia bacterium]
MGEETTIFDFLPGLSNLQAALAHSLGRVEEGQGFYFRWQMFGDSHFTMSHVYGASLVLLFALIGGLAYRGAVSRGGLEAIVPPPRFNLRNLFEMFTDAVMSVAEGVMGKHNAERFLPLIGTLAVFIFFSNVLALIPGFIPPTSTLKTNLALAVSVFFLTHFFGVREHGLAYFKHFLGPMPLLAPLMLPIELVSHVARPVSLSLRLLGNIAADHKVVSAFFVLVPLLLPIPFLILGVLVAIVQTLVFCLLTMVYIQGAVAHEEH